MTLPPLLRRAPLAPPSQPSAAVAPPSQPAAAVAPPPNGVFYAMASLYVGDLHPETTEIDVAIAFFAVAPFVSVKLCRDRFTHKSLCYAYVNYFSHSDAAWAMSCLNHTDLRGKRMRIMWCQKDPTMRKTGVNNLFVKNLHPSITSAGLHGLFSQYGAILSCKVAEENGKSKGFGFVHFATDLSALSALSALNGTLVEGKKLYVSKFVKKNDRMRNSEREVVTNLCVKNLEDDVTIDQLKQMFSAHGKVCTATTMKDDAVKSRGYGFVKFASHEEAKKATETLNGSQIGSKILLVERDLIAERKEVSETANTFTCKYQQPKSSKLYVGNLDASMDAKDLEHIFHAYGKITSANIVFYQNGVSRGFGFVCFSSIEEARKAINSVNGTNVHGRSLIVDFARSNNERSRQSPTAQYLHGYCTSNWNVFNNSYHASADSLAGHYHMLPAPKPSAPYLRSPQQVGLPVQKMHPIGVHKQYGNCSSSVWSRSPKQSVKQELAFQPNSEYMSMNNQHSSLPQIETKEYHRWEIKKIHDSPGASFNGSKANRPSAAASSTDLFKIYSDKRIQPSKENIQVEHQNMNGMLMEAGSPDKQNWKHSQSFRVKVEKEH